MPTGTSTLTFGTAASRSIYATAVVTGQTGIVAGSKVEAYLMADITTSHSADEHIMASQMLDLVCGDVAAGVGFTVYGLARDLAGLVGSFTINWVWV